MYNTIPVSVPSGRNVRLGELLSWPISSNIFVSDGYWWRFLSKLVSSVTLKLKAQL